MAMKKKATPKPVIPAQKRPYLKQTDIPAASLDDALRVPGAIFEHYGGLTATPLQVAKALDLDPGGSQIRVLTGAAIAFGLVEGGAQAAAIPFASTATPGAPHLLGLPGDRTCSS